LRTTSSGSMSRTRTPERYGGAAPRGLLPGLVPMVDGQEGGGSGGRRPSEVRWGKAGVALHPGVARGLAAPPLRRGLAPPWYDGPVGLYYRRGTRQGYFGPLNWLGPHVRWLNGDKWMELGRNGVESKEV
jgi:hypothetical protein